MIGIPKRGAAILGQFAPIENESPYVPIGIAQVVIAIFCNDVLALFERRLSVLRSLESTSIKANPLAAVKGALLSESLSVDRFELFVFHFCHL